MKKVILACFASGLFVAKAQDMSLYDAVTNTPELSTLTTAIGLAGLQEYLTTNTTDLTLFAPTDDALQLLPAKYLTPGFTPHLKYILEYHIVPDVVLTTANITDGLVLDTVVGEQITAAVSGTNVLLSGAAFSDSEIVTADLVSTNGYLHLVDQYFFPERLTVTLFDLTGQVQGFERVLDLIVQSGLESSLTAENRSVLAPSDTAFAALPEEYLDEVSADAELRDSILLYHVIIGSYPQEIIVDGLEVMTASGNPLRFGVVGGGRFAQYSVIGASNNVTFGPANLIIANGMLHTIDGVLEAPPLATTPTVSVSPVLAPTTMPIATIPIPVTTIAPASAPIPFVTNPLLPTPGTATTAPASAPIIPFATNPPLPTPGTATGVPGQPETGELSLYETIILTSDLSTLSAAIAFVGLEDFFKSTIDLTLFLPTNAAFRGLPTKYLTLGYVPHLKNILEYHVVKSGVVPAAKIQDGVTIDMLNGDFIFPKVNESGVVVSGQAFTDSRVIIPDLFRANNCVGHVVDLFFLPQALSKTLFDLTRQTPSGFQSFLDLITEAGLEEELRAENRTCLAISDTAFAALPAAFLTELSTNTTLRDSIVLYHIVIGSYPLESIVDGMEVMTASEHTLRFGVIGDGEVAQYSAVGPANVVTFDSLIIAANGIRYTTNGVLEAPLLVAAPTASTPAPLTTAPPTSSATTRPTPEVVPTTEPPIGPPPFGAPTTTSASRTIRSAVACVLLVLSFSVDVLLL